MRFLRTFAAIIGGYLIFALSAAVFFKLAGRAPHSVQPVWFMIVSVVYGMLFAALGGLFAARVAPSRPVGHAIAVAAVLAVGAVLSLRMSPGAGSTWSQWCALLLMAPSAWLGGRIAAARLARTGRMVHDLPG